MHHFVTRRLMAAIVLCGSLVTATAVPAADVNLTDGKEFIKVSHHNKLIEVRRDQDPENLVDAMWAKTSRKCPPFCIQPTSPAEGVEIFTELDVFEFMEQKVNSRGGVIIDARLPEWHLRGTIPGSVNIPFTVFQREPNHPELVQALSLLGVKARDEDGTLTRLIDSVFGDKQKTERWDFSEAKEIVLWCNGPWCGQSPHAIRALVNVGYPPQKIKYYRGGMQMWEILGLTIVVPEPEEVLFAEASGSE